MIKSLLYFAILTTAVVLSWIGFSINHNYTTSTISQDTSIRIIPIEGRFDQETIGKLKKKKVIPADLSEIRDDTTLSTATDSAATSAAATKL